MDNARRRRIARLFTLVLLTELALLCCASACLADHICPDCECCAICACVRSGMVRAAVAPLAVLALLALLAALSGLPERRDILPFRSLFARKVRFND